ncbi:MAG: hypothetical protein Q7N50_03625 [Armatimonadota bacterium]|nr:hypothetical protein [Armatimonadota bacterium]
MNKRITMILVGLLLMGLMGHAASAAVVTLSDSSQTTTLTANVSEQCSIVVPSTVTFNVTDISGSTAASGASVTISNIVLATATKQLKLSIQASAAAFTPSVTAATTWAVGDVTWNAATWTTGTGASGTLSSAAYTEVATATADSASCSTTGLVFTLAAKTTVKRSGNHTLATTWKVESIGA